MSAPKTIREFVDRGPLLLLGIVLLPTMLITVPVGFVLRCLWDGISHGWAWAERNP